MPLPFELPFTAKAHVPPSATAIKVPVDPPPPAGGGVAVFGGVGSGGATVFGPPPTLVVFFFGPEATRHRALPIPRGTCLWASPDGPVVAVTTDAALRDFRRADRGAWWTTELATRWGAFVVGIPMDRRHPVVPASTCDAPPRAARVNAAAPGDAAAP